MLKIMVAVALVFGFSNAFAEFEKGACKEDIQKFCKDVKPGHGAMMKCLKEHKAELSAGCQSNGEAMKEKMKGFRAACKEDIKANCADIKRGEGRILDCLRASQNTSEGCKAAIAKKH